MKKLHNSASGIALLGALMLLGGCVLTSVYPFYNDQDVVFEPKLVGRWSQAESAGETNKFWEFTRAGTNAAYTLMVRDSDEDKKFRAHFFRLQDRNFIDATPEQEHDDFIPPHYLLKVSQLEPTLKLAVLNYGWLRDLLKQQPGALRHTYVERKPDQADSGRLVLTANTSELQQFILKYAADTNAFSDDVVLTPQK